MNEEFELLENNKENEIKNLIYEFRGKHVMLDSDIAKLFNIETRNLNKAMNRNVNRFPEDFCFKLNSLEFSSLKFQNGTSKVTKGGRRKLPNVYTEQGIIALAGVLKSNVADEMSVKISRVFVKMRYALIAYGENLQLFSKWYEEFVDFKEWTISKFDNVLNRLEKLEPKKEVLLLDDEWFDAYEAIVTLVERAKISLVLVDPYADDKSLVFLSHKNEGVTATIYKGEYSKLKKEEVDSFSKQYGELSIKQFDKSHNRYLIIDSLEVFDLGTSLNKVGNKIFTINKIEIKQVSDILINLFQ